MGKFTPDQEFLDDSTRLLEEDGDKDEASPAWSPFFRHGCTFDPNIFQDVMLNLIKNPNINSSWLFRADILYDGSYDEAQQNIPREMAFVDTLPVFKNFQGKRVLIRKLIPRNALRDKPLDQTCIIYQSLSDDDMENTLVVYLPHISDPDDTPFYHPKVKGIAFLHEWSKTDAEGHVSLSFQLLTPDDRSEVKLTRTALQLLMVLHKHGQGRAKGYVKRVHHDTIVPQITFQDKYAELKQKYASSLIKGWAEVTDPEKHVFEDLGIAAFLIELWKQMYQDKPFPGFVDIGCGNGLLVYILNQEGYKGWGFDARTRKSWANYNSVADRGAGPQDTLCQRVLLPSLLEGDTSQIGKDQIHDGRFPTGTFIVSNHADELTPWTPILATLSDCPFIMIPCCSHNLGGSRFRAPTPKDKTKAKSTYASLVEWVAAIAHDCGWQVETEMLRIPSTRNTALVGRTKMDSLPVQFDVEGILAKYGGVAGYVENAIKLVKSCKEH